MRINIIAITISLSFLLFCSPSTQEKLEDWSKNTSMANAKEWDNLVKLTFDHSYRESRWNPDNQELFVEYGGSSALTFTDSQNYVPRSLLDLARKSYRTYYYGRSRGIKSLRVSLVKPFYVKNSEDPNTEIQEFEVYRAYINEETWKNLSQNQDVNPFETNEYDLPEGKFHNVLDELIKTWKVELNEFPKIEVE